MNRKDVIIALSALALVATGGLLKAGPLNPPPGPVTSTYKTLTEVEPRIAINATNTPSSSVGVYTISQPGSYYLTENLVGTAGFNGIGINLLTPGAVTIDLNGFEIVGNGGSGNVNGIANLFGLPIVSLTVRNGTIRNWASDGIDLAAPSCTFIDLRVRNNGATGITSGPGCTFINCIADDNGTAGIATGSGCVLTNCVALSNNTDGFLLGSGSTITSCTAYLNSDDGIAASNGCNISHCTSYANTGDGIEVGSGCFVNASTCDRNGFGAGDGAGIRIAGSDNRVDGNNCTGGDRGVEASAPGNLIMRNTCSGNGTNWVFVAGNSFGEIKLSNSPSAPAINTNGNTAGTFITSDPFANISY